MSTPSQETHGGLSQLDTATMVPFSNPGASNWTEISIPFPQVFFSGVSWNGLENIDGAPHGLWARSWQSMLDQMVGLGLNVLRLPFSGTMLRGNYMPQNINYFANPDLRVTAAAASERAHTLSVTCSEDCDQDERTCFYIATRMEGPLDGSALQTADALTTRLEGTNDGAGLWSVRSRDFISQPLYI
jgi:hypothetical protein